MIFFSLIFLPTLYFSSVQTGISGLVLRDLEALAKVKHCQEEKASDDQPGHRTAWTHSPQTKHPNSVGLSYIRRQRQEIRSFSERKLEDFLRNLFPLLLFDINLYRSCGSKSFCGKWFDSCRGPKEKHPNCLQQRKLTSHMDILASPVQRLSLTFPMLSFWREIMWLKSKCAHLLPAILMWNSSAELQEPSSPSPESTREHKKD